MTHNQTCPICSEKVTEDARYPNYVCNDCTYKAVTEEGEKS